MSDALATYLHDHLAGSTFGIDLLRRLVEQSSNPLGRFGQDLLAELTEDQTTLEKVIEQAHVGKSELKQGGAWLGEKITRLKLSSATNETFGIFESLEILALGILGKAKLWKALSIAASADSRLRGFDFDRLAGRAEGQHERVEQHRIQIARTALTPSVE